MRDKYVDESQYIKEVTGEVEQLLIDSALEALVPYCLSRFRNQKITKDALVEVEEYLRNYMENKIYEGVFPPLIGSFKAEIDKHDPMHIRVTYIPPFFKRVPKYNIGYTFTDKCYRQHPCCCCCCDCEVNCTKTLTIASYEQSGNCILYAVKSTCDYDKLPVQDVVSELYIDLAKEDEEENGRNSSVCPVEEA